MKQRKVPMRKCVISNEMKPKKDMVRIVRSKEGDVTIDPSGKKNGRGAYVSVEPELVEDGKNRDVLSYALNVKVPTTFYDELYDYVEYKKARAELLKEQGNG
ncbi:MAG TPA: YlxR family RNase P modulator [Alloiococcus sp.]|nr:YlxR family RNase P modulator [Alloiococcus sp.]